METKISFWTLMDEGGPIMWILLGASVLALAFAVERFIALAVARRRDQRLAAALERRQATAGGPADWLSLCRKAKGPLARILSSVLETGDVDPSELRSALEGSAYLEIGRLRRGLPVLATTANLAPLLGFFGTVTGMMVSFDAIAGHGLQNPALVAVGIKEALTTTAGGLAVAIPAQLAFNLLLAQIEAIANRIESVGEILLRRLALEGVKAR